MIRVKDPRLAAEKISAAINGVNALLAERQQPLIITPATSVQAEGFRNVTHPLVMMFLRLTVGVSGDWLIIGSSESAVNQCLNAAAGKVKTVAQNPRFLAEGVVPTGPVVCASFHDLSTMGQELSTIMGMMAIPAFSIPDEPGARTVKAVFNAMARLSPAFAQLDFFRSSSSVSTFDGQAWTSKTITTYQPPKPVAPVAADHCKPSR